MRRMFRLVWMLSALLGLALMPLAALAQGEGPAAEPADVPGLDQAARVYLPLLTQPPIVEAEANDTRASATPIAALGPGNAVEARINRGGDVDWYRFAGVAGRSYTIELFNADLALGAGGRACDRFTTYSGLFLSAYDGSGTRISSTCSGGSGNVNRLLRLDVDISGTYYLRVEANSSSVTGAYRLRVLPRFGEPAAGWDGTFEPNNTLPTAYEIPLGYANARSTRIEPRSGAFATAEADVDWYRFAAVAGRSYVIELFDVDLALGAGGRGCDRFTTYDGLFLRAYDPTETRFLSECSGGSYANVHTSVVVDEARDGWYYFRVQPNSATVSGQYSVRVLPRHDEPGAAWDQSSAEPNNRLPNAYALTVGAPLRSQFERQSNSFVTFGGDIDWYRFTTVAGRSYTVEVRDIDASLNALGRRCDRFSSLRGVVISLYDETETNLARDCSAADNLVAHNTLSFRADRGGTYYIALYPNASVGGAYTVRVSEASE